MGQIINVSGGAVMLIAASQFPEYSQQYVQRLGGAVDELRLVAADFDASAQGVGMTREEALGSMTGNAFQEARRADMTRSFTRLDRLERDLVALEGANAFSRLRHVAKLSDKGIAARAFEAYRPAVPVTFDGFIFAIGGFLTGFGALRGITAMLRRRRQPLKEVDA